MKRKLISAVLACAVVFSLSASAFAATYATCDIEGCARTGTHYHDGTCYAGHTQGDGHGHAFRGGHHGGGHHSGGHH